VVQLFINNRISLSQTDPVMLWHVLSLTGGYGECTFKCELNKKVNTTLILFCMLIFRTVISIELVSYCSKQKVLESFVYYKVSENSSSKGKSLSLH